MHTLFLSPLGALLRQTFTPASPARIPLLALLPLAVLLGAAGRRIAGGVLNQIALGFGWIGPTGRVFGDYPARAIYGVLVVLGGIGAGAPIAFCTLSALGIFLGCAVPMWAIDPLARGYRTPVWLRFLGLTAHGLLSIALVTSATAAAGLGWPWLLGGSLSIGAFYSLGVPLARLPVPAGLRLPSEIGEALWGAAIAVCFVLSIHGA